MRVFTLSFMVGTVAIFNFGFGKTCGMTYDDTFIMFDTYSDDLAAQSVDPDQESMVGESSAKPSDGICPSDMVLVDQEYCPQLEEICLKWEGKPTCGMSVIEHGKRICKHMIPPMMCKEWKYPSVCKTPVNKRPHVKVCVNKHEGSNKVGEKPKASISFYDAEKACQSQGKRLCTDVEWQSACRGPENNPYSTGYTRPNNGQCNIDTSLPWKDPSKSSVEELDEAFLASGSKPECKTTSGIYDMTGNYDEWVRSTMPTKYTSVLFSGHPFHVRNRCTTKTTSHSEGSSYYDISYRCCKDAE